MQMKEYNSFERIGTLPHRSYYIPFSENDKIRNVFGIVDRHSSSRFLSLDGVWNIKPLSCPEDFDINESLDATIPVPSCVQMHGYDQIQYLNSRYPFPVMLPHIPHDNPSWHYRREFELDKKDGEKYYLNFEGVDSAFYLYINGTYKGYSQISHATSEFDITELVKDGVNVIDVLVLKWCVSTYLECQDKFRFSGIFRNVYILKRPEEHITDYRIIPSLTDKGGVLTFINESKVSIDLTLGNIKRTVAAGEQTEITVKNTKIWTAETPNLYTLTLRANGEKIIEKVGFREVKIDGKVFKINGEAVKLKGVNRHDFNCKTGATVTLKNLVEDLKLMKFLNVNAVRTSHYPNMPEFYQLCDAFGIYVMDEADLEMHGAVNREGAYDVMLWREYAENEFFEPGITDRHKALVERDKNRSCVVIWSLGNESSFGKAFFPGANYIRARDSRPVHYESLQQSDEKYYYTELVDMVSMMYPSFKTMKERVLENPEETRPYVLCEYTHAMGNSCGDIAKYWDIIYNNEQCMGAFVWEWADHGIKTKKGFLYGGDFGESEHDGNFCCDGLLTPDRKLKSNALEMKAVYAGKTKSEIKDIDISTYASKAKKIEIEANEHTGELTAIKVDGTNVLRSPIHLNILRYIDNDRRLVGKWNTLHKLNQSRQYAYGCQKTENGYKFNGVMAANCLMPALDFDLSYAVVGSTLEIELEYKIAQRVESFPRVGLEFAIDSSLRDFSYVGFGPYESYSDKKAACEYGYYKSNADDNYDMGYVRPQESGSHYATKYLEINGLCAAEADAPFSFSVNPYTTKQLYTTTHNFDLPKNDFVNVCLDAHMRGIGSNSCGPSLGAEYEIPTEGKIKFTLKF